MERFTHVQMTGPKEPNPLLAFTAPFSMSRNPTLFIPGGPGNGAPPPSLQLVGHLLGEMMLISAGSAYERATEMALAVAAGIKRIPPIPKRGGPA
jgi:Asp-tRNA(Asn)/Glu-tRNA(Gln) amidotransferase A subunit family amidase